MIRIITHAVEIVNIRYQDNPLDVELKLVEKQIDLLGNGEYRQDRDGLEIVCNRHKNGEVTPYKTSLLIFDSHVSSADWERLRGAIKKLEAHPICAHKINIAERYRMAMRSTIIEYLDYSKN